MVRLLHAVAIVVILAAGAARCSAQPPVEANSQAEIEKAKQLNEQVETLYGERKYQNPLPVGGSLP